MGNCYQLGLGTSKNEKKAIELYQQSADGGNFNGQYNLACCYLNGTCGVEKNESIAFRYLKKAADQGGLAAMHALGWMYYNGQGTEVNIEKSDRMFQIAAENGYAPSQSLLGLSYYNKNDFFESVKWFKKAAEQKDDFACLYLGKCYETGCGLSWNINKEEAYIWYEKAAELGNEEAIAHLEEIKQKESK